MRKKSTVPTDVLVDDTVQMLLKGGPIPTPNANEALCNAVLHRINEYKSGIGGDDIDAELLEPELRTAVIAMLYAGREVGRVPYVHIRHALANPVGIMVTPKKGDWEVIEVTHDLHPGVSEKINGPLKAIRALCTKCTGGSVPMIRSCPTVNCFLWPFRMGGNPMFGRLKGASGDENEDGFEGDDEAVLAEAEYAADEAARLGAMGA